MASRIPEWALVELQRLGLGKNLGKVTAIVDKMIDGGEAAAVPQRNGHPLDNGMVQAAFAVFWEAYPKRAGANPKKPALEKFTKLLAKGESPLDITDGARRYADSVISTDPKYIAQARTWLNEARWKDENWVAPREQTCNEIIEELRNGGTDNELFRSPSNGGAARNGHY